MRSGGDARAALNALELATRDGAGSTAAEVTVELAEDAMQKKAVLYDKGGDRHYDYISAWIKATRGSDVDASIYYLAVMLEGGEDPRFIARRMIVLASEDIGNADPQALQVAVAAAHAVEHVGMPECALNLSQAAAYLALAPKSNASLKSIGRARADVREHGAEPPPAYLRDAHYYGARKLGRGVGYEYPHELPDARVGPVDAPGGPRGPPLLRADRARVRGRAAAAMGRDPGKTAQERHLASTVMKSVVESSWPRQGRPVKLTGSRFAALLSIAVAVVATGVLCAAPSAMAAAVSVSGTTLFRPADRERAQRDHDRARTATFSTVRDGGAAPQSDLPCTADGDTVSCDAAGIARLSSTWGRWTTS